MTDKDPREMTRDERMAWAQDYYAEKLDREDAAEETERPRPSARHEQVDRAAAEIVRRREREQAARDAGPATPTSTRPTMPAGPPPPKAPPFEPWALMLFGGLAASVGLGLSAVGGGFLSGGFIAVVGLAVSVAGQVCFFIALISAGVRLGLRWGRQDEFYRR